MGFVDHRGQGLPALPQEKGFVVGIQSAGRGRSDGPQQVVPWRVEHSFLLLETPSRESWESSRSFQAEGVVTGGSFVGPHNFCLQATEGVRTVIIKEAVGFA